ncbi:MAG: alpha-N-arabinofuranosidase [Lachnospiraceae bacterium]|nr:alpha-N-arabinofuranosidase [Lachnospiraceae bacterium]
MDCIRIDRTRSKGTIAPELYGHFSEQIGGVFYDGIYVGEESSVENIHGFRKALVDRFKALKPPVLRWPGGCFSETYDWRDGIGPKKDRPRRANWWYSFDHRVESNQVGTHEFMDFCRLTGAEPYLAANMTSVPALHIRDWIEYCTFPAGSTTLADERAANGDPAPFPLRYVGIGNENWGGGGQMSPEMCAREYIRFSTILKSLGQDLRLVMCGANGDDLHWTRGLMAEWAKRSWQEMPTWGVSIHYYNNFLYGSDPLTFDEKGWYDEMFGADHTRRILLNHRAAMDEWDPERKLKIVLDEWGNWHRDGSGPSHGFNLFEQQSNMRDALVAAVTLNIFNEHCDILGMANVAQLCNNLHSLFLAGGDGFTVTPNYHVFDMYKEHQGGRQLHTEVQAEVLEREGLDPLCTLSASASEKDGALTLTLANLSLTEAKTVTVEGLTANAAGSENNARTGSFTVLHAADPMTVNTFEDPEAVHPVTETLGVYEGMRLTLPAASVAVLRF